MNKINKHTDRKAALFVSNWFSVSAQEYSGYTLQLVSKLTERAWDITTTSSCSHRYLRAIDMCFTAWRARRLYNVAQVDVFSPPALFWAEAVSVVLGWIGKPYILTLHGGNLPKFIRQRSGHFGRLLSKAAAVTTPSRYILEHISPHRSDTILLPYAIDIVPYQLRNPQQPVQPKLVWLRAFHRIYNPLLAAHVLALLRQEYPNVHLYMVGPDKGDGSLNKFRHWVTENDLESHVTCVGGVPKAEVPRWLQRGDIFLNTTTAESFGVSVMEAAAMGLCIVTTNVGELPYLWQDGEDALLVPPNHPQAMANAVLRLLKDPQLAQRLSLNARRNAEQFDWSNIIPLWEKLLIKVMAQH